MEYQDAKSWLQEQLGHETVIGDLAAAVAEVREKFGVGLMAGSPREHAQALIRLHELDYHVLPVLRGDTDQ